MLKESLANALYDPAMNLALEQERVDGAPEIVDDGIALDYDAASIGVDLDLGDVAAVREGLSWRHSLMRRVEPRADRCSVLSALVANVLVEATVLLPIRVMSETEANQRPLGAS